MAFVTEALVLLALELYAKLVMGGASDDRAKRWEDPHRLLRRWPRYTGRRSTRPAS
jgi:hypothetical protein